MPESAGIRMHLTAVVLHRCDRNCALQHGVVHAVSGAKFRRIKLACTLL